MKKSPYIKLFKTINNCYFYDVNRNDIVPISKNTYDFLEEVSTKETALSELNNIPQEIISLLNRGYLSNKRVSEIEHPVTRDLELILERRIQKITLQLTQNCNFRCKYCHYTENDGSQRTHSNKKMSMEIAKKSLLFFRDHSIDTQEAYIGFYGGEPLLEFPMLKEIVDFSEKLFYGKKINYMITTNSVLLNDEIIKYMIKYDMDVLISLDGPKKINDQNRVMPNGEGTFDKIIERLKYIYNNYREFYKKLTINMVMNPSHDFDMIQQLFKEYPFLGKIEIMSTVVDDIGAKEPNIYKEHYLSKVRYHEFLAYLSALNRVSKDKIALTMQPKVNRIMELYSKFGPRMEVPDKFAPGGPCIPGELRLMVTIDGKFIACERVNEISDCMILGDIETGIQLDKAKALLNVAQVTSEYCKDCWAFFGCTLCGKFSDDKGKLSETQRLQHCQSSRNSYLDLLKERALLQEASSEYGQISIL